MFLAVKRGVTSDPLNLLDEIENLLQASGSRWAPQRLSYVNKSRNKLTWANSSGLEAKRQRWPKLEVASPHQSSNNKTKKKWGPIFQIR